MKVGFLSDIHVDINADDQGNDVVTVPLSEEIKRREVDCFICAGDIASDYAVTLRVVDELEQKAGVPCYFLPGNHDLWNESHPEKNAWEIYEKLKKHPRNIAAGPIDIGKGWSILGETGWYDYSFGSSRFSLQDFERKSYGERVWQDSIKAVWDGKNTIEMHRYFLAEIDQYMKNTGQENIIAVTHVLPVSEFCVPMPHEEWDYFNAFLGSGEYGELLLSDQRIKYSISGHVHYRKKVKKGHIEFCCNCLGYRSEWFDNGDAGIEIARSFRVIEI